MNRPSWAVGHVVVIDPGHGGIDGGANLLAEGILEKDLNLAIALNVQKSLRKKGFAVVMTREHDQDFGGKLQPGRHRRDLQKRIEIARKSGGEILVSIHVDAADSLEKKGPFVLYQPGQPQSRVLAGYIQESLKKTQPWSARNPSPGRYYLLQNAGMTAVIVETGYLTNPAEKELLKDTNYQCKLADAISDGIEAYFKDLEKQLAG